MFTLDPHAARSCLLKVHHRFHPGLDRPESRRSPILHSQAASFRASVNDALLAGEVPVTDLRDRFAEPSLLQEEACLTALAGGAELILGGLLPRDWEAHRAGRPEVLVADPAGGYLPGIIRSHRVVDPRGDSRSFRYSDLTRLNQPIERTGWGYRWNQRWANALQLAHLWRLLEATGYQSRRGPAGLVIGSDLIEGELRATWLELDQPLIASAPEQRPAPDDPASPPIMVSALERYDHEFALRVELAELAAAAGPEDPPLLHPVVTYQCSRCDWWPLCRAQLDDDDLSLRISKSRLDASEVSALRAAGIHTVQDLAAADLEELLPTLLLGAAHRQGAEDRLRLAHRRAGMLARGVALERLSSGQIPLRRAALEVDIDIETAGDDRVYLWGFRVSGAGKPAQYVEFSEFADLDEPSELALAHRALRWLRELVSGSDSLVYHYSDYEVTRLRRLASADDDLLTWALDYAATNFVDLFEVVREHYFGAEGLGLKVVATAGPGFAWRDEYPGGLNSMSWFAEAVHGETEELRGQARRRVLEYNEDDVTATAELREWLTAQR